MFALTVCFLKIDVTVQKVQLKKALVHDFTMFEASFLLVSLSK